MFAVFLNPVNPTISFKQNLVATDMFEISFWLFLDTEKLVFGQVSEKRYLSTSTKYSPKKVLKYKN